jgi:hypothetical protein
MVCDTPNCPPLQITALDEKLARFSKSTTWRDAPVENAQWFHRRIKLFMTKFICPKANKGGVLGRVQHWLVRYEVQQRGSCEYMPCLRARAHLPSACHPAQRPHASMHARALLTCNFCTPLMLRSARSHRPVGEPRRS